MPAGCASRPYPRLEHWLAFSFVSCRTPWLTVTIAALSRRDTSPHLLHHAFTCISQHALSGSTLRRHMFGGPSGPAALEAIVRDAIMAIGAPGQVWRVGPALFECCLSQGGRPRHSGTPYRTMVEFVLPFLNTPRTLLFINSRFWQDPEVAASACLVVAGAVEEAAAGRILAAAEGVRVLVAMLQVRTGTRRGSSQLISHTGSCCCDCFPQAHPGPPCPCLLHSRQHN